MPLTIEETYRKDQFCLAKNASIFASVVADAAALRSGRLVGEVREPMVVARRADASTWTISGSTFPDYVILSREHAVRDGVRIAFDVGFSSGSTVDIEAPDDAFCPDRSSGSNVLLWVGAAAAGLGIWWMLRR